MVLYLDMKGSISNEIFIAGAPILVTVEPASGYIFRLNSVDSRNQETWSRCWLENVDNETGPMERIVADQAKGIIGGIGLAFGDVEKLYQTDLFHIIIRSGYWVAVLMPGIFSHPQRI